MLNQAARQFLIAEEALVIQNALYTLLAGVESKRDAAPGTRERLEEIAETGCDKLILELRAVEEPLAGITPRIRSIRYDHLGKVVAITCEVAAPHIAQQTEELGRPHLFPKHLGFSLGAFVYTLSALF
jgi:hypothetical protein